MADDKSTGAPNHVGTEDLLLLYYSIIKDRQQQQDATNASFQNLCPEESLQQMTAFFNPQMVEVNGIEPMASCVQGRRSPS